MDIKQLIRTRWQAFKAWQENPRTYRMDQTEHVCNNCGHTFRGNYCPVCSQAARHGRIGWRTLWEGIGQLWGIESRSGIYTLWQLFWRPGYLVRDYISGKRQVSYPPVKLLFILAAIIAVVQFFFPMPVKESVVTGFRYLDFTMNWLQNHENINALLSGCVFILPTWWLFRGAPRYPHHTIPEGFFIQVYVAILSFLFASVFAESAPLAVTLSYAYMYIIYKQLFGYGYWATLWRLVVTAAMSFVVIFVLIIIGLLISEFGKKDLYVHTNEGATTDILLNQGKKIRKKNGICLHMSFFFCNFAAEMYVFMNCKTIYVCLMIALAQVSGAGMMQATEAGTGVFSVSATKAVRFATAKVTTREETHNLYQWSEATAMEGEGWTLLSNSEWSYLLASGRADAANKNALGSVAGDSGLIILPDVWVQPADAPTFNGNLFYFDSNTYTAAQWEKMEAAGAVFLPCGGYGHYSGGFVFDGDEKDHGTYWTSTANGDNKAYCMRFHNGTIHDQNFDPDKTTYRSVILVQEVTILDEVDDADTYFDKWDAAKGKDFAYVKRTLKKDSTLYTLCLPFDVPDIDDSPLAGAEVFEFKGGRVSGTTGNERLFLQLSRQNGKRLTQGVPYLLRWAKTSPVETLSSPLYFANVENWDTDTTTAAHPGNETIKLRGVYPKTHIPDYTEDPVVAHYNFFLGANNTLYWPDKTLYPSSDMKGFRAYFYITAGSYPASAPKYRNMPMVWQIGDGLSSPTGVQTASLTEHRTQTEKLLRNGKVILLIDDKEFDLQGKQLK